MKIGYDFDGVFHKNVSSQDGLGERNFVKDNKLAIKLYDIEEDE